VQLGDGRQRMPMISLGDYLRVVAWAVSNEDAQGAYNLAIPSPASNAEFTTVLAQALSRPRFLRAPAGVLRKGLGELAEQLVGDLYAVPRRLTEAGFVFEAPDVASAVRAALAGVTVPGIPAADL